MKDFAQLLEAEIPRLRRYARALTRDVVRADDLVQNSLTRALDKRHLWQPGTDLRAWLFTILHNQHVTDLRCSGAHQNTVAIDDIPTVRSIEPDALDMLKLRDLVSFLEPTASGAGCSDFRTAKSCWPLGSRAS